MMTDSKRGKNMKALTRNIQLRHASIQKMKRERVIFSNMTNERVLMKTPKADGELTKTLKKKT